MNINLTLFIQVVNFFITYWLMSKGILSPVLKLLQEEKAQKRELEDHLASQEFVIQTKQKEMDLRLKVAQGYFKENMPESKIKLVKLVNLESITSDVDSHKIKELASIITRELKSRIING